MDHKRQTQDVLYVTKKSGNLILFLLELLNYLIHVVVLSNGLGGYSKKFKLYIYFRTDSSASLNPNKRALKFYTPRLAKPLAHSHLINAFLSLVNPSIKINSA